MPPAAVERFQMWCLAEIATSRPSLITCTTFARGWMPAISATMSGLRNGVLSPMMRLSVCSSACPRK